MNWAGLEDDQENSYAMPQGQQEQPQRPSSNRSDMTDGTYTGRATGEVTWGMSQNQNLQACVLFRITSGPFEGQYVSWVPTFAEGKATEIAINGLRACGWKGMDPTRDLSGLTDNDVDLVIEMQQSQAGNIFPTVKFVNRQGSGALIRFKQPVEGTELHQWGPFIAQAAKALWVEQHPNEPVPGNPGQQRMPQRQQPTRMVPPDHPMGQPQGPTSEAMQRQQYPQQRPAQRPQQQQLPTGNAQQRPPIRPAPQQSRPQPRQQQPQQQPEFQPGDETGYVEQDPFAPF